MALIGRILMLRKATEPWSPCKAMKPLVALAKKDILANLLFATRADANEALDLARGNNCEVETFGRTRSTLEEVFMKTVEGE